MGNQKHSEIFAEINEELNLQNEALR